MNITKRILVATLFVIIIFMFILAIILGITAKNAANVQSLFLDSQKGLDAFETLLQSTNQDATLLNSFLDISQLDKAQNYSDVFSKNAFIGRNMTLIIQTEISEDKLQNQNVIQNYNNGIELLTQLRDARDIVIDLHLEELRTNRDLTIQKVLAFQTYQQLSFEANTLFVESVRLINADNQSLQEQLISRSVQVYYWIATLFIVFLFLSIFSSMKLITLIARPIDEMASALKKFTSGHYDAKVQNFSSTTEIKELQEEMNSVLAIIQEEVSSNKERKAEVEKKLLPTQLKEIIIFIQQRVQEQRVTTMKDIKKQFHLTYPTVQSRVSELEKRGYIRVEKVGRDKHLFLIE